MDKNTTADEISQDRGQFVGAAAIAVADGPPVILLHGWPYDIHAFVDVAPWVVPT